MRLDKNIWIAFSRVLPALILVLLLSSCSLYRVTRLNNYENFAEISNTVWARLYFAFNEEIGRASCRERV